MPSGTVRTGPVEGDVKHRCILAAFATAVAAMPAQAQPVAADLLPASEVAAIVASMGMRPVGRPAALGGRYVIAAIDRHGREVNIVLDARDGQVIAVRPLARNSFGAPPRDGAAPAAVRPGAPPPEDDEFFDDDRQQGSLPPRAPARAATPPREPAVTGSAPAERKSPTRDATPIPRPRPALARANDPGHASAKPADQPAAAAKPDKKPEAAKPDGKQARPGQTNAAETKPNVRVIDLSKPKDAAKPEDKPGQAIRF